MTGYVRQSAADIIDGAVVEAQPLNDEFNMLQSAFAAASGHSHDGSPGSGAPITAAGPTLDVNFGAQAAYPRLNNFVDLGTPALRFRHIYLTGNIYNAAGPIDVDNLMDTVSAQTITGVKTFNANVALENDKALRTELADTTAINLLNVDASDNLTLGDAGISVAGVHVENLFEVFVADHLDSVFWVNNGGAAGDGSQLTNLNASAIATGTLADARIPATVVRTSRLLTAGSGIAAIGDLSADRSIALTGQALAFHTLASEGVVVRTNSGVFTRSLSAGAGITVSTADGVAGNPTISADFTAVVPATRTLNNGAGIAAIGDLSADRSVALTGQALAIHNLATNGLVARTGAGTFAGRLLTAGTGVAVTNGNGVSGDPTVALTGQAQALHELATNGIFVRTSAGTVQARTLTSGTGISITNGDGVSGNPLLSVNSSDVVMIAGTQTVSGEKVFSKGITLPNNVAIKVVDSGSTPQNALFINASDIIRVGNDVTPTTDLRAGSSVRLVAGGTIAATATSTGVTGIQFTATSSGNNFIAGTDTAANPSFTWTGALGRGMFNVTGGAVGFAHAGVEVGRVGGLGFVGGGSQLTSLNASELASGTVPSGRLPIATNAEAVAGTDNTVVMTPLRTLGSLNAFTVGRGQSISSPARSAGTSYQNNTASPIVVIIDLTPSAGSAQISANGSAWTTVATIAGTDGSYRSCVTMIVPVGYYYRVTSGTGINNWTELR